MSTFGGADADCIARCLLLTLTRFLSDLRRQQWRQHTKASVSAEPFMWKCRANRKQWDIATANHAGPGQLPRSMLSPFGNPTPCGLLRVRNMLPRSKDQIQSTAILQEMRWPSHDQSSYDRIGGCICSEVAHFEVQPGCAHQLCRHSFTYAGRTPQAEGFSQRVWRLRRRCAGVRGAPKALERPEMTSPLAD